MEAIKIVVSSLVEFIQNHGNRKSQDGTHNTGQSKYKVSMCRDLVLRGSCPRTTNCTFAHSDLELDKYRSKNRKLVIRTNLVNNSGVDTLKTEKIACNNGIKKQCKDAVNNFNKNHDKHLLRESKFIEKSKKNC